MKIFYRFLFTAVILVILSAAAASAFGQKESVKLSSLSENATIAETQEWLIAVLTQNSAHLTKSNEETKTIGISSSTSKGGYTDTKISGVKFQGSMLTYKIKASTQIDTSGVKVASNFPAVPIESNSTVQLDLKDINPEEITLQSMGSDSKEQSLALRTYDYKKTIKLRGSDSGAVTSSVATMVISGNLAEQVQAAFIHLIKLVQEQKP